MKQRFDVVGMTCSACAANIERVLSRLDGTYEVSVNLLNNNMTVEYNENVVSETDIVTAVYNAGFEAFPIKKSEKKEPKQQKNDLEKEQLLEMKRRLIISMVFSVPLFYISMGHMMGWPLPDFFHGVENAITFAFTQFLLAIPVVFVNKKYYIVGFKSLFAKHPNMDSLIAIGTSAALVYGIFAIYRIGVGLGVSDLEVVSQYTMDLYFESAAVVLALITLGKFLEARAKNKTSEAIKKLVNLTPKTAVVIRNGKQLEIDVEDLELKDIVVVKPGQIIPTDGIIVKGKTSIDESMLTGESLPVERTSGDKVIGASINKSGYFEFEVSKLGEDTVLSQIIKLVEEASSSKAPIAKLADKISSVFVPVVITIALISACVWLLLGYSFEFALSIGISVLVISCPCALGLATPTAIMVGTGKGAENGILIKSAQALEIAHTIDTVVMDKTGTITNGRPQVTDLIVSDKISKERMLQLCASVEQQSEHPLAEAVVKKSQEKSLDTLSVEQFEALHGLGIKAVVDNINVFVGNKKLMQQQNISLGGFDVVAQQLADDAKTPMFFANDTEVLGIVAVADTVKHTSQKAIDSFKKMGIEVIMLTGDNKHTANAIGQKLGIDKIIAEVLPQDKEKHVRDLIEQGKKVAMIGDGINDAPALVRADVGIAIGAGTDVAIESADIVLVKNDLLDGVKAVQLSKSVIRNIKQNLFWAFIYNVVGIPLAAGVFFGILGWKLNPMFAGAAMSLSSVSVVSNALRLKFFKPSID